jgi:hypothetical protein
LQEATNAELRLRLAGIFQRYRKLAFIGRNDNLFTEHWTPEVAAAGYDFDGFEIKGANIVLRGIENACRFIYRINIALPLELIDDVVQSKLTSSAGWPRAKLNQSLLPQHPEQPTPRPKFRPYDLKIG